MCCYVPLQGDSGGPMWCSNMVVGVASWVIGNCLTTSPNCYTRVSEYRSWIDSNQDRISLSLSRSVTKLWQQ